MPDPDQPAAPAEANPAPPPAEEPTSPPATQDEVLEALRTVKDPELGVNIVDLGLVYTVQTRGPEVDVEMTLTSPACPAGPEILRGAVGAIQAIPSVAKANVKLVLSPPWSPDRMSDSARDELGMF